MEEKEYIEEKTTEVKMWIYGLYVLIAGYSILFLYILACLTH